MATLVRLTKPWTIRGGPRFDVGDLAGFDPVMAAEIVRRGCGLYVTSAPAAEPAAKQLDAALKDKMIAQPERKKGA